MKKLGCFLFIIACAAGGFAFDRMTESTKSFALIVGIGIFILAFVALVKGYGDNPPAEDTESWPISPANFPITPTRTPARLTREQRHNREKLERQVNLTGGQIPSDLAQFAPRTTQARPEIRIIDTPQRALPEPQETIYTRQRMDRREKIKR